MKTRRSKPEYAVKIGKGTYAINVPVSAKRSRAIKSWEKERRNSVEKLFQQEDLPAQDLGKKQPSAPNEGSVPSTTR